MSRPDIEYLIERYLRGETTAQENELVERWLAEHDNANTEWQRLNKSERGEWLNDLFSDIESTIAAEPDKIVVMQPRRRIGLKSIAAIAAVLLIGIALFVEREALQNWINPTKLITLQVPANQKRQLTLADGSTVWLNAGAELKYPETFNGSCREVYLTGEAYFDVVHKTTQTFTVHTGKVLTTVLGTAFNINAGKNYEMVVVTVTKGKVSVINDKQLLGYITPNQQITYNKHNNQHVLKAVNAQQVAAWQETELRFDDITFEQAVKDLQQRFNVHIAFSNDKLKNCRFSGAALKSKNINQILKVICAFNNASYRYNAADNIVIDGKGCDQN